jgi:hypothetical protein
VYRSEGGPHSSSASLTDTSRANEEDPTSPSVNQELILFTPAGSSGSMQELVLTDFDSFQDLPVVTPSDFGGFPSSGAPPVASSSSDLVFSRGNSHGQRSYEDQILSVISSALFPGIPPPPHVPLSFLGEPNIQISRTTPELEMTLWVTDPLLLVVFCADVEVQSPCGIVPDEEVWGLPCAS